MVSQKWEARFNDIDFEELAFDPELLASFRSRLGAVLIKIAAQVTGYCATLSLMDLRRGSVVLVFEVSVPLQLSKHSTS